MSLLFLTPASLSNLSPAHFIGILSMGILSGLAKPRKLSLVHDIRFATRTEKVVVALSVAIFAASHLQSSARISYDASSTYFSNAKLTALQNHMGYYLENTFVVSIFQSIIQYTAVM